MMVKAQRVKTPQRPQACHNLGSQVFLYEFMFMSVFMFMVQ